MGLGTLEGMRLDVELCDAQLIIGDDLVHPRGEASPRISKVCRKTFNIGRNFCQCVYTKHESILKDTMVLPGFSIGSTLCARLDGNIMRDPSEISLIFFV